MELQILVDAMAFYIVFLINCVGHWMPWFALGVLADESGELRREFAYIHGTLSILIGTALSFISRALSGSQQIDLWLAGVLIISHVFAAALGTFVPRLVDLRRDYIISRQDSEVYEQALTH